jgi:hypothetical protein
MMPLQPVIVLRNVEQIPHPMGNNSVTLMRRNTFLANAFGWIGTPLIIVYWVCSTIAYIWSIVIAFKIHGIISAGLTLMLPVVSQLYWVYKLWDLPEYSSFIAVCITAFCAYVASKIFIIGAVIYERKAEENNEYIETEKPPFYGFGGWLILVSIGQLYAAYLSLSNIFETDLPAIQNWGQIAKGNSGPYVNLLNSVLWVELIGSTIFLGIIAFIAYLTIKLHRYYKFSQIGYLVFSFIYSIVVMILMLQVNSFQTDPVYPEPYKASIQIIIQMAIWIPYFLVSKRVKNTFMR